MTRILGCSLLVLLCFAPAVHASSLLAPDGARTNPLITTVDSPLNHLPQPGSGFDAVAKIIVSFGSGTYLGSGALIGDGSYLLTAAHVVSKNKSLPSSFTATFGSVSLAASAYYLPSSWNDDFRLGSDIAIVKLAGFVPGITPYELFEGDALGQVADLAGYGRSGTGETGDDLAAGTLRTGKNRLDARWNLPGLPFAYDFDEGSAAYDALGLWNDRLDPGESAELYDFAPGTVLDSRGLGILEAMIAPGDSGGPTLIGGKIAGVHSFGGTWGLGYGDWDGELNSSFGEAAGDTRVAAYSDWIEGVINPVPEPATLALLGVGLLGLVSARRRW